VQTQILNPILNSIEHKGGSGPKSWRGVYLYLLLFYTLPYLKVNVSLKMSFSETGLTCIYLSVLNVKIGPRGAKI
jgi:hypothetical protein